MRKYFNGKNRLLQPGMYRSNFNLESYGTTNTPDYRIALSYAFKKKTKSLGREAMLKKL